LLKLINLDEDNFSVFVNKHIGLLGMSPYSRNSLQRGNSSLRPVDPSLQEILSRTNVGPMGIVLALASGALFLFLANLISVNLAGVATFLAQGIEPRTRGGCQEGKESHNACHCGLDIIIGNTNDNSIL